MSAMNMLVLPVVWAVSESEWPSCGEGTAGSRAGSAGMTGRWLGNEEEGEPALPESPATGEMVAYRRYTEGMLRRYLRLSMEAGRVSSMMGRPMFRGGRVTSYRIRGFDDVVIFVHDVERCLERLDRRQQKLIERVALQEHTQGRTAALLGISLRSVNRRYQEAVDALSAVFLEAGLLEPLREGHGVET